MKKSRLIGAACICIASFILATTARADLVTIDFDSPLANYTPEFRTIRSISDEFQSLGILFGSIVQDESGPGCAGATPGNCKDDLMLWGESSITLTSGTDYFSIYV